MGFFSNILKSPIAKIAIPVAASFIAPGIGTALSSGLGLGLGAAGATALGAGALGSGLSLASGQNIGQALKSGALSGGLSYGGSMLSDGLADTALGRGLSDLKAGAADTMLGRGISGIGSAITSGLGDVGDYLGITSPYATGGAGYAASPGGGNYFDLGKYSTGGAGAVAPWVNPDTGAAVAGAAGGGGRSIFNNVGTMLQLAGGINSYAANEGARKALENYQNQYMAQLQPYSSTGQAANTRLSELLGIGGNAGAAGYGDLTTPFTTADLANDPGYKFQLQEGTNALANSASARGGYLSGAALKELNNYAQGLASTTFQQAFDRETARKQNLYNQMAGVAGKGLVAANAMGEPLTNIGTANAASTVGKSNIIGGTLANLTSLSGANKIFGYNANGTPIFQKSNAVPSLSSLLGLA